MNAREIASIAFGRSRKGIFLSLVAYFDGSGKEDDHAVITVGGFLADASICEDIEQAWEEATARRLFHLKTYGRSKCHLGSVDWTEQERAEYLKRLASIVNREQCYVLSASIEIGPYNKQLGTSPHAHVNGPAFSGCAQAAIATAEYILLKEGRQGEKLHYTFEKGDREHEIVKMMKDFDDTSSVFARLRSYSFNPKSTTSLLQPADLIAGIIQRCVLSAHSALPCLENGLSRTALYNFEHRYSPDGVTAAVVSGHDHEHCWIINAKTFSVLDRISAEFFTKHPHVLAKRLKQTPFKPRRVKP